MKKIIPGLILLLALLTGCAAPAASAPAETGQVKQYQASFLELFDTVTTVLGYAGSEEEFSEVSQSIQQELLAYHQLFDIYDEYEGIKNLKTVNDSAGIGPVEVDERLMELLIDCKEYYALSEGRVNVFMGSVLKLWHDARTQAIDNPGKAILPAPAALEEAALHCDPDSVILDPEAGTVFITDPALRIDVGAVAKGWAAQRVSDDAPRGMLISVGGNVCATGPKPSGKRWVVGVQSPDEDGRYVRTLDIDEGAVVTSGDYQRYFLVDGVRYHHIIDPETLQPADLWRSVTVVSPDSGLADCLSTALFLCDAEQGQALLDKTGAEAMWLDAEGNQFYSDGFKALIHS